MANIQSGAGPVATDLQALSGTQDVSDIEDPQAGAMFIYTSGTAGRPEGVLRTRESFSRVRVDMLAPDKPRAPFGLVFEAGSDRSLTTGPLYDAGPLLIGMVTPLLYGVGFVVMRRWNEMEFLRRVEEHRITHTLMVPIMFHRLFHKLSPEPRFGPSARLVEGGLPWRRALPTGDHASDDRLARPVIVEYYGATELAAAPVPRSGRRSGSSTPARWAVSSRRAKCASPTPTVDGHRSTKWDESTSSPRPVTPLEYHGDTAKTDRAYTADREYYTVGDIGGIDDQGYFYPEDRDSNLIISGGVSIYPADIEAVLLEHPHTTDIAVISVPDTE